MSAFDMTVNVIDMAVDTPDPESIPEGAEPIVRVSLVTGMMVPMMTPQGIQPALIGHGAIRFNLDDRAKAEAFLADLQAAIETLPQSPNLGDFTVASNMAEVEEAQRRMQAAQNGLIRP